MASPSNKKLLILYVLQVLKEYSDENHPLMQVEISRKIYSIYGMTSERKAIGANIQSLIDYGYDIQHIKGRGVYLGERELEPSEIALLVDSIFSNRSINAVNSKQLAEKLYSCLSKYNRKRFNYVYKVGEIAKSDNKQIFLTIEILQEAIGSGKKVSFDFIKRTANGNKTKKRYTVSPYILFNSQGVYYLICCMYTEKGITNFRLDRIENVSISEQTALAQTEIKGYENGLDIAKIANENIYAFGGKSVTAKIKLYEEKAINYLYEWFGDNAKISPHNGETIATVKVNERAIVFWAVQYGYVTEVLEPKEVRKHICELVNVLKSRYIDN